MSNANSRDARTVTLIPGDGIGPEVVQAAQRVIEATGVPIDWETCEAGMEVFKRGLASGVPAETIASITRTRVALKGPLETPIGFGEKSANVTLRKLFETYGNLRPIREFPGVQTPFSGRGIDLIVVRENVEDLYAGIEHMQTPDVAQCLKLISRKGCEKITRLAFEVARSEGRKRVHCVTKSNIMKLTEGLLKQTFEEVAQDYPDIEAQHILVDNCAHQLVRRPEQFEVLVTTNMNGDILSDLTSGLIGGLGFAPSANLGSDVAIFEAVHGSAPKYAGKNVSNPTAVILSGAMMLRYLGYIQQAVAIERAILATLQAGIQTRDTAGDAKAVSTSAYTDAVISRLEANDMATTATVRDYKPIVMPRFSETQGNIAVTKRRDIGVDIFVESDTSPEVLGQSLTGIVEGLPLHLKMVSNRGTKVYPSTGAMTDCINHWRCRFVLNDMAADNQLNDAVLLELLKRVGEHYRWMHSEKLPEFDGKPGFTRAQGEDEER